MNLSRRDFAKFFALIPLVPGRTDIEGEKEDYQSKPPALNWTARDGSYGCVTLPSNWRERYHPVYVSFNVRHHISEIKAMDGRKTMITHVVHGRVERVWFSEGN